MSAREAVATKAGATKAGAKVVPEVVSTVVSAVVPDAVPPGAGEAGAASAGPVAGAVPASQWLRALPTAVDPHHEEDLGSVLRAAGRLDAAGLERIHHRQREQGLSFEDAALGLGLLRGEDLEFALARQFGYPYLFEGDGQVSTELVMAYRPFSAEAEALRGLRTELKLCWFDGTPGRRMLAVVGTERGDGRSWLAANLAVAFSQLGERTLLIDADLRGPRQHLMFNLASHGGLSAVLAGRGDATSLRRIGELPDLAVLPAGAVPPNPQELLGRPSFTRFLEEIADQFDIILIDTPAAALYADAQSIAARAGAALLVARRDQTRVPDAQRLAAGLTRHGVTLVGSVLNAW